jgi:outer membrane protein
MRKTGKILSMLGIMLILSGLYSYAPAQEKLILTLEDSIRMALEQNPYHLAAEEKISAAKAQMREAASGFFPSLSASGLQTLDEKVMELEFPSMIPGQPPQKVQVDFTRDYQFSLSLSLPLYTGGRLKGGFRQAKYNLETSQEVVRQSRHLTVFNTKSAFYGYLLASEFVKVSQEAVSVAEKFLKNVKAQYGVGMASKFDLLRSEVQLANLQPQLIKARNSLKAAELGLKTVLGLDLSRPVEIMGRLEYNPYEAEVENSIAIALQNRPELKQMNFQKKMAAEMLKLTRAEYLPTVAITGSYNYWADALNLKKDNWSNYYAVNLAVSLPIFNGFSTAAKMGQTKAMIRELDHTVTGLRETIKLEVRQAFLSLQEARESLLSQEKNVEQALESLRIAELNFTEGMVTTLEVSSTQAQLTQARTNYSQALFDYMMAVAQLERAMGLGWEEYDADSGTAIQE